MGESTSGLADTVDASEADRAGTSESTISDAESGNTKQTAPDTESADTGQTAPDTESADTGQTAPDTESGNTEATHDIIFVGGKPIMTYVNATLTLIKATPVVTLMARGHRIRQAVDVALTIVKRMRAVGYVIGDVRISSNPMESLDGKSRNISTIEIDIQKSDS